MTDRCPDTEYDDYSDSDVWDILSTPYPNPWLDKITAREETNSEEPPF